MNTWIHSHILTYRNLRILRIRGYNMRRIKNIFENTEVNSEECQTPILLPKQDLKPNAKNH